MYVYINVTTNLSINSSLSSICSLFIYVYRKSFRSTIFTSHEVKNPITNLARSQHRGNYVRANYSSTWDLNK